MSVKVQRADLMCHVIRNLIRWLEPWPISNEYSIFLWRHNTSARISRLLGTPCNPQWDACSLKKETKEIWRITGLWERCVNSRKSHQNPNKIWPLSGKTDYINIYSQPHCRCGAIAGTIADQNQQFFPNNSHIWRFLQIYCKKVATSTNNTDEYFKTTGKSTI